MPIQQLQSHLFNGVYADVLRIDTIHPIISGNKWFKLKYYIEDCKQQQRKTIATFGGTYSNHIVATAFACKEAGLNSIGIIRGETIKFLSHTLQDAANYGMKLQYVTRDLFKNKQAIQQHFDNNIYWINEGGYGIKGMKGAADIVALSATEKYTHIIAACGTGTMLAGLITTAKPHQNIIGISVFKNNHSLETDIKSLLKTVHCSKPFSVNHHYHFGGYAKHPKELIYWMNELYSAEKLPTDIVYTAKLLFAVKDLCNNHYFNKQDKLLIIHSGGLQGNLSLPLHTLSF
ncbi:MAG: pyridoxal-phosphate dependent enzyme [Chitinophagaceae bacterium]|nr:pyridoxal-phosphate dependent enzyme [Chitinophagaceae bacterium]MCW5904928.1 pyridoxal-phosphate dependent enzyme [Chitinophagaceae bacterium]